MTNLRKFALAALPALALGFGAAAPASALTQLGFILDESGSIGSSNWTIIKNGLANAIGTLVPTDGSYQVTVVKFGSSASTVLAPTTLTAANVASVVATIQASGYNGGSTNMAAGINLMASLLNASQNSGSSYVNVATDGVTNDDNAAAAARVAMTNGGVDNVSVEGIGGGIDVNFLQTSICFPGPCDTTVPFNFPAQGFYIGVANAQGYADAIGNKIQVVTSVPEPMSLALFGMGLAGLGLAMRRRAA